MKKVTISISSKSFDVTLEDDFALFFEAETERLFKNRNNVEIKDILGAFIQECFERYNQEKTAKELINKIDSSIF